MKQYSRFGSLFRSLVYISIIAVMWIVLENTQAFEPFVPFPYVSPDSCLSPRNKCFPAQSAPSEQFQQERLDTAMLRLRRISSLHEALLKSGKIPSKSQVFEAFLPVLSCSDAERVGRIGDGGKWVCDPDGLRKDCIVYSFGGSDDLSFELEMHDQYGCETHTFDPSPGLAERMNSQLKESMYYHSVGLGPTSSDPGAKDPYELIIDGVKVPAKSLADIAEDLHADTVDVLKLDIEGSELSAIPQFIKDGSIARLGVRQLLVEIHYPSFTELKNIIDLLINEGFLPFSKETNIRDTGATEFSFVKRDFFLRGDRNESVQ